MCGELRQRPLERDASSSPPFESSAQRFAQVTVHRAKAPITVADFLIWKRLKKLREELFSIRDGSPAAQSMGVTSSVPHLPSISAHVGQISWSDPSANAPPAMYSNLPLNRTWSERSIPLTAKASLPFCSCST